MMGVIPLHRSKKQEYRNKMKFIKKFSDAEEANDWAGSEDYVTPNVVLIAGSDYGSGLYYEFDGVPM